VENDHYTEKSRARLLAVLEPSETSNATSRPAEAHILVGSRTELIVELIGASSFIATQKGVCGHARAR
jgi:hypothetical protein